MIGLVNRLICVFGVTALAAGAPMAAMAQARPQASLGRVAVSRHVLPGRIGAYPYRVRGSVSRAGGIPGSLWGVAAITAGNAWAVGNRCLQVCGNGEQTLIEHWNGRAWTRVPSPNPHPSGMEDSLFSVSAVSARDAWAVGYGLVPVAPYESYAGTLTEHWNGKAWAAVPSLGPSLKGGITTGLYGVSAVSATSAWAVGESDNMAGDFWALILRWNGRAWVKVRAPRVGMLSTLAAVSAVSAADAWAVGGYVTPGGGDRSLILHWNGRSWTRVPVPAGMGLSGVSAVSADDAWAAGSSCVRACGTAAEVNHTLMLHWDGRAWTRVPSPHSGWLAAVSASSATSAWAVGWACTSRCGKPGETVQAVTERWNGHVWTAVTSPKPAGHLPFGVTTLSRRNAWAVGMSCSRTCDSAQPGIHPLVMHWNGKAWSAR